MVAKTDPRAAFLNADIDRQRAMLRELVEIRMLPGPRGRYFDPELIETT